MTTAPPPQPTPPAKAGARTAPLALWRMAEAFLQTLHTLFGAPEDVARKHTLTQKSRALMLSWLRAGEALLRRLLLIEAFAHMATPCARKRALRQHPRTRKLMSFNADEPEAWRVSFRCFLDRRRFAGATRRKSTPSAKTFRSAWPIAERYEALLRAFNDPAPYAHRLARRLQADPRSAEHIMRIPKGASEIVGAETFKQVGQACISAAPSRPPCVELDTS